MSKVLITLILAATVVGCAADGGGEQTAGSEARSEASSAPLAQVGGADTWYYIQARHSGKCLHQFGATTGNGDPINQWDCVDQPNVQWRIVPSVHQGYYFIQARHSGKCLHQFGATFGNGDAINQWDCVDQPNVLWQIIQSPYEGYYYFKVAHSGKCLHQFGATGGNGDPINQWDCVDQPNVQWRIIPVSGQPTSTAPSGGARTTPVEYNDPDLKCYRLTAYGSVTNKAQKYAVPITPDLYVGFNFYAPWPGTQYIKSLRSVIDNRAIIHHWQLYRALNGGIEGIAPNQLSAHPDAQLLYAWAPGGSDLWFDADVGMGIPSGSVLQLEAHYNNRLGGPSLDGSGVEVCVTPRRPTYVAGMSFVGTDAINGVTATGTCTHQSGQPIRLIMSTPHMHTKGRHMRVDLTRTDGRREIIHDQPFDFSYQRSYVHNVVIQPGDRLTTTCSYGTPARFGRGTSDEVCNFFSLHWPAGALSRNSLSSLIHGPNTCMD